MINNELANLALAALALPFSSLRLKIEEVELILDFLPGAPSSMFSKVPMAHLTLGRGAGWACSICGLRYWLQKLGLLCGKLEDFQPYNS